MKKLRPIEIQPMLSADLPACVQILTQNDLWQKYGITTQSAHKMLSEALSGNAVLLTARVDGQPAGFAWLAPRGAWERSSYLRLIGVLPACQRMGIGLALLRAVEEQALQSGSDLFLLVTDSNLAAQRFYKRCGYQQVGALPDYVVKGITELIFYKRLKE